MEKKSIAKNYIFNLIYQMLTIFLPLITTPYLSRVLGAEQIGIYGYTCSIVTYFILFGTLGINMYGQREMAYLQNSKENSSKSFWELIIIRSSTLAISMLLFYFVYASGGEYSLYYKILLIQMLANMFDISWLFQGIEEFDKTVIRNLIVKLLSLVLIFVCVKSYDDLWIYFLIYAGAEFIGNLSIWAYVPKYINKVKIKELDLRKHIRPVLALFLPQIAVQIYTVLDKTMIGVITDDMIEVGYYEQAQKVVRAALMVVSSLQTVMNSRIANAYANNDNLEVKKCLGMSFSFVWLLAVPMMFGLIAIADKFVPWYYGASFEGVTYILMVTAPILIAIGLNGITGVQYLVQTGKQSIFTKSVIVGSIVNVILNFMLINKLGGVGAAIASVVAEISIFLFQLRYFKSQFSFFEIMKLSIKYFISGIVMFGAIKLVASFLPVGIIYTLIEILVGCVVYFILLLILRDKFFIDLLRQVWENVIIKLRGGKVNV